MKTKPRECVVIEDALSGIIAAKRAGMKCIALMEGKNQNFPADLIVSSPKEINTAKIMSL